jgi:twitching motility protein PilJ
MAFKLPAFKLPKLTSQVVKRRAAKGAVDAVPLPIIGKYSSHMQLQIVGIAAATAFLVILVAGYLDYRATSFGARYIELSQNLRFMTQRVTKDAAQAVQGNQLAIEGLPHDKQEFERVMQILDQGEPGLPPLGGAPRDVLETITPNLKRHLQQIQDIIDGRPGIQTVFSAVDAVNELNPIMREEINQLASTGAVDNARVTKFALLMERISQDVTNMLGATVKIEQISALGADTEEAEAMVATFNKSNPAVTKVAEHFDTYRTSVEAIIGQVPQLLAAKKSVGELFASASVTQKGDFIESTNRLSSAIESQLSNRWTTYLMLAASIALLLTLLLLAKVYLDDARHRAFEAEGNSRRNQQAILLLMNEMSDLADGDLTVRATVTDDITGAIADSVNYTTDELRKLVSRVTSASDLVANAAGSAQDVTIELLKAAHKQATELRDAGEAVGLITRSIQEVDTSATQSAKVAQRTLVVTEQGALAVRNAISGMDAIREQIQETAKRIKRLGESSQEIGDIVDLISDITEQTNVLALNAAIQAASAGEAGRGFSVVAEEVQRLAERSAEATKQISALVKTIQGDTQDAVAAMEKSTQGVVEGARLSDEAGQSLREIEQVSHELADLISSISVSTQVQTDMAQEVAATMAEILKMTERTTEDTRKTADSVTELANLASDLKGSVSGFKL